jgi:putative two-component response regulator
MVLKSFSSSNQGDIEYPEKLLISLREAVTDEDLMREYLVLEEIYQVLSIFNEKYFMILLWDIVRILNLDIEDFSTKVLKNEESPELLLKKCLEDELKKLSSKKQLNAEKREQYQKKDIVEITNYISKHVLDNNFSVKSMATEFDVSVSNLSHFFKKNTGVTISNYITSIKLERAKYILLNSDKTIEDIAKSLGYSNATVFIEMFKKNTGESPGNYRKTQIKS